MSRLPHSRSSLWLPHRLLKRRRALANAKKRGTGTPERAQPVRRTITHELPSGFDLGTVNAAATQRTVSQVMGIDFPAGCFAPETVVKFKKEYEGGRTNLGSVVIQLTKDEHDAIV